MTRKKICDPNYQTKLSRKMSGMGFRMWSADASKTVAISKANKLRKSGRHLVRVIRISQAKNYPWPWAVYYKKKGGW